MAHVINSIKLSTSRTFLWRANKNAYKGLEGDLGIESYEEGKPLPKNGILGGNQKPVRIHLRTTDDKSFTRFIDTKKIATAVHDRGLIGKKVTDSKGQAHTIAHVSVKSN